MSLGTILFIGLVFLAVISPLLTFSALFQQKEWRMDRLVEHLRREGFFSQLFGSIRPAVLCLFLLWACWIGIYTNGNTDTNVPSFQDLSVELGLLLALAILAGAQFEMRRQRVPKWTHKAILLLIIAAVLSMTSVIGAMIHPVLLPFVLLLQPLYVCAAWILLWPLDSLLKKRVMNRDRRVRSRINNATVIGIAGSVGKTTTKELLKCVLQDLHPLVTPEHVNTEMGVAGWMIREISKLETQNSNPVLIVEMGAYRVGEIKLMSSFVKPTIGVMTALGSDHLALFGSEEKIIKANGELIAALPQNAHAFLYGDNDGCKILAARATCPVTLTNSADLIASNVVETPEGISFSILNSQFSIPLHGLHNVDNILLAIGVARKLGKPDSRIAELLLSFRPLSNTFNVRQETNITILDDTYNSSRLSITAALDWAKNRTERPRVLLMSGLLETGSHESAFLEELGSLAKDSIERVIFTTDTNTQSFAKGFQSPIEVLNVNTARVPSGSLILALGRMSPSAIKKLLPR